MHAWYDLKSDPSSVEEICNEVIWLNKNILIDGKYVWYSGWYEKGVVFMSDIINETGKFLKWNEVQQKFSLSGNELQYISLLDAVPKRWRDMLKKGITGKHPAIELPHVNLLDRKVTTDVLTSKQCYNELIKRIKQKPTCIQTWANDHGFGMNKDTWQDIFLLPFSITKETKLREFQLKIIHRVYATDSYVANFCDTVSKECQLCHTKNDIPHFFYRCAKAQHFWSQFVRWFQQISPTEMLTVTDVLFGKPGKNNDALNYCIMQAKWYLHIERKSAADYGTYQPFFLKYLCNLKQKLLVEKQIATRTQCLNKYLYKFARIEEIL